MRIDEVLDEIKRIARKYLGPCEVRRGKTEDKYWVDVVGDSFSFSELDGFSAELSRQLHIDRARLRVSALGEEEIGIGFLMPYLRVLTPSEVEGKFISVEEVTPW